jgi:hypothetical protein
MSNLKKKKLGERIGGGLIPLKGNDEVAQVFSIVSDDIFSYVYHYDDVYETLGKFMCLSEYDEDGKIVKKADCCKLFKKKTERVIIPVIHYEGKKKNYRKMAEGKFKYLSITSYKYTQLCKDLEDAGVTFEDCNVDILLKSEDANRGKISFEVIDSEDGAFWREDEDMVRQVKEALKTWEEDVAATLPTEYASVKDFLEAVEDAKEMGSKPEGVEDAEEDDIPKKKKKSEESKPTKKKVEKELEDDLDEDDEDEEEETPKKKKKKSVKEQIEEEDFDNEELDEDDEEDEDEEDEDDLDEDDE